MTANRRRRRQARRHETSAGAAASNGAAPTGRVPIIDPDALLLTLPTYVTSPPEEAPLNTPTTGRKQPTGKRFATMVPVLRAIAAGHGEVVFVDHVAEVTGLTVKQVQNAAYALSRNGHSGVVCVAPGRAWKVDPQAVPQSTPMTAVVEPPVSPAQEARQRARREGPRPARTFHVGGGDP